MNGPTRTDTFGSEVLTFRSCAAVGLIVQDNTDPGVDGPYQGVFLTPEQARKIAAELLAYADEAQADFERTANLTEAEKHAAIRRAMGE